jgi:hypothetical protein
MSSRAPRRPFWCEVCGQPSAGYRALYCNDCRPHSTAPVVPRILYRRVEHGMINGEHPAVVAAELGYASPTPIVRRLYRLGRPDLGRYMNRTKRPRDDQEAA